MTGLPTVGAAGWGVTLNAYLDERVGDTFTPESYGAVGDGTTDDTQAFLDCIADALPVNGTIVLGAKTYGISDELQLLGVDQAVTLVGQGKAGSILKALDPAARVSWGMAPTGSGSTGVTVYGRPGMSRGWKFDGNLIATRGVTLGVGHSHGLLMDVWSTRCDGDPWHVYSQNSYLISCISDDSAGATVMDYGVQACQFIACHFLSCDDWQLRIQQSGGPGWGMSAQPQNLHFQGCIWENGGAPAFADTGLGGVYIREGLDITFERCDIVDVASSDANAVALKLTPSTANGYVGRIVIRDCRIADVHIDANSGGVAQGMGGTNEPLQLDGWNYSVFGGTITNGSTGPVYNDGRGVVSYTAEGTNASPSLTGKTRVVDEIHADTTIVNTTTETTAAQLAIPRTVAAGDLLRLNVWCDFLNNSGGAVTYTFRLKIGATTALASGASSVGTSTGRVKASLTADILLESVTAQRVKATLAGTRGTDGWGTTTAMPSPPLVGYGTAAENLAAGKNLTFTVQMGTASASADFVVHAATLEVVKKS